MELSGKWKIAEAELGGKKLPSSGFDNMILEMDENSYQLHEKNVIDSGLLQSIPGSSPAAMTITSLFGPNQGKTFYCIYQFEGKDLIICYNLGGEALPESFRTVEHTLLYLVRYKRIDG
jgi:uncharacterized protein (TIGR03067 family)